MHLKFLNGQIKQFAGCILGGVLVVIFCKKRYPAVVGNTTFYKGNECACDGDSDSTFTHDYD